MSPFEREKTRRARPLRAVVTLSAMLSLASGCALNFPLIPQPGPTTPPTSQIDPGKHQITVPANGERGQLMIALKPGEQWPLVPMPQIRGHEPQLIGRVAFDNEVLVIKLPAGATIEEGIAAFQNHPAVMLISPHRETAGLPWQAPRFLPARYRPNDPMLAEIWGFGEGVTRPSYIWGRNLSAKGVRVAVIDTGVDPYHPELQGRVRWELGYNFNDSNGNSTDLSGHGTHVAGILAAAGNNGIGIAGVAWEAEILPIKIMDDKGGTDFAALAGIKYAVEMNAKVLNLSFSRPSDSSNPLFDMAIDYARKKGAVVVVAAGNNRGKVGLPANSPGAIAVSATEQSGSSERLASFSNSGPEIRLSAPGADILSTIPNRSYKVMSGTSMAAPFVSGAAALLWAAHPDWSVEQIEAALLGACVDLGPRGRDSQFGYGRIDYSRLPL
ncbi:Thermophilic serine proteinase precursor [compost metagenome]